MACEQYCTATWLQSQQQPFDSGIEKCKHTPEEKSSGGFECSICLDSVSDPVVTLCGHLYCWACIYEWIRQQSNSPEIQCPVCKAEVSEKTLIPLYGPGRPTKAVSLESVIPARPNGVRASLTAMTSRMPPHLGGYYGSEISVHPVISMFGEMICGNQHTFYANPNSYSVAGARSARGRRRVMHAQRSLTRLNLFLCCCLLFCLLLF